MPAIPNISIKDDLSFALRESSYTDNSVLAANTAKVITIPTDTGSGKRARYIVFSSNADFWIKMGGAAAIPAADVTDGSGSELNPTIREIPSDVTTIGIIAPAATLVSLMWYIG